MRSTPERIDQARFGIQARRQKEVGGHFFALRRPVFRRGTRRTAAVCWRAAGGNFCELAAVRLQRLLVIPGHFEALQPI